MNNNPIVYRYGLEEVQTMNNPKQLHKVLNHSIKTIVNSASLFVNNPDTDFIRDSKLNLDTVIKNINLYGNWGDKR